MTHSRIPVSLGDRSYEVVIGERVLGELREFAEALKPTSIFIVTDSNVGPVHAQQVRNALVGNHVLTVPAGEASKSVAQLGRLYDAVFDTGQLDRHSLIVALGGGVVGDLAGFLAATVLRGVHYVQIPTSLLAMVDSSVGGKTGINHFSGKNLIGAFHQPSGVFCDLHLLETLPKREYVSALAEVVKTATVADKSCVAMLEDCAPQLIKRDPATLQRVIEQCVRFKAAVVEDDERESTGRRATLNFGHTVAHVLEAAFPGRYLHGEAVAVGIGAALRLSFARADLGHDDVGRVRGLMDRLGLSTDIPEELDAGRLLEIMARDKKRHGNVVRFVVVSEFGEAGTLPCRLDEDLATILLGRA